MCEKKETFEGSLREALPPPFMRGFSVLHFSTVMTLSDIVVKPLLIMLLLPGPLLPVM